MMADSIWGAIWPVLVEHGCSENAMKSQTPRTMDLMAEVQVPLKLTPRSERSSLKREPTVHSSRENLSG